MADRGWEAGKLLPIALAAAPLGFLIWAKTHSLGWAAAATIASLCGLAGLLWFLRFRTGTQLRTAVTSGRIDVSAFLDMASLPGTWPADARRTMGLAKNNAPAMPVRLTADDEALHLRKTKYGSHPFTAEIALRDLADVTAGDATVMPIGATLCIHLRDGTEVRFHLHLSVPETAELATLLRDRRPSATSTDPPAGIVITSPAP